MKKMTGLLTLATLLSLGAIVLAQQPVAQKTIVISQAQLMQGPEGGPPPPPPGADFMFVASESFGGKTVKGAPYSAEAVTESIQTLSDGNRIVNRFSSSVYRDSEGRMRREQTLKGLGVLGAGDEGLKTIFINDPVAGVTYTLDTRSHVAHKSVPFRFEWTSKSGGPIPPPGEGQHFEFRVAPGEGPATSGVIMATPPVAGTAGVRVSPPEMENFHVRTEGGSASTFVFRTRTGSGANEVKEQLGKQMIEGVEAEGTRTTVTIPAGDIGNERPIEIVSERWYSAELQLVVMTRHSDPRSGETTYKLTNINRSEPARSLFEVPADFTIKTTNHAGPNVAPLPRMRKQSNPE